MAKKTAAPDELTDRYVDPDIDDLKAKARIEQKARDLASRKKLRIEDAREQVNRPREEIEAEQESLIAQGSEGRRSVETVDASALDHREKIGRALKLAAAVPIEISNIWREEHGRVYRFEVRDKKTGHVGTGTISHEAFLNRLERDPKGVGKWFRRLVNASLGRNINS